MLKIRSLCNTLIGGKIYKINGRTIMEEKLISEGAYSFVYVAKDLNTNKIFALKKTICQDKDQLEMSNREIAILKSLPPHKNIVQYYGSTVLDENNYKIVLMLMEYCERGNLLNIFEQHKHKIREIHIVKIMKDIICGLNFLHVQEVPIIHRDIKLENILCDGKGVYKVCDFGSHTTSESFYPNDLKKQDLYILKEEIERDTTLMYRPPELIDLYANMEISTKIDIWMAGCILYLLLFKVHPFQHNSFLTILNCSYKIPNNIKFSKRILSVLIMMLAKDPEKRIDSTTLLYIFENYTDLKKWIIHVSNEIKAKVNTVFDKIGETPGDSKQKKHVEINNGKVLESKIGNEDYKNQLQSNYDAMPLKIPSKSLFSQLGIGGKNTENTKKGNEANKVAKEKEETDVNKTSTDVNSGSNATTNSNSNQNNPVNTNNSTPANKNESPKIHDISMNNNGINDTDSKTVANFQRLDGKKDSHMNNIMGNVKKDTNDTQNTTKHVEQCETAVSGVAEKQKVQNNSASTDNLIKIDSEEESVGMNHFTQLNTNDDKSSNYFESRNLFDLSDNSNNVMVFPENGQLPSSTTIATNANNNNKNTNSSRQSKTVPESQLIDITTPEEIKVNKHPDNIHFTNASINPNANLNTLHENEGEHMSKKKNEHNTFEPFDVAPDMFNDVSLNTDNSLMDLDDYLWDKEEKKTRSSKDAIMNRNVSKGNNAIHPTKFSTHNRDSDVSICSVNNDKYRNYNTGKIEPDEKFGKFFDPWTYPSENVKNDIDGKSASQFFSDHENYFSLNNKRILKSTSKVDNFKSEEKKNNKLNNNMTAFSTVSNYSGSNCSQDQKFWNFALPNNNTNTNNNNNNVDNSINKKDTVRFSYETFDSSNSIHKTTLEKEKNNKKDVSFSFLASNNEQQEQNNSDVQWPIKVKNKNTKNVNTCLILSDKNDKFSELLEEFQKI